MGNRRRDQIDAAVTGPSPFRLNARIDQAIDLLTEEAQTKIAAFQVIIDELTAIGDTATGEIALYTAAFDALTARVVTLEAGGAALTVLTGQVADLATAVDGTLAAHDARISTLEAGAVTLDSRITALGG